MSAFAYLWLFPECYGVCPPALHLRSAGKSDPYVIVRSGKLEARSRVIYKTLDPVWNEDVHLNGTLDDFLQRGLLLQVSDGAPIATACPLMATLMPEVRAFHQVFDHDGLLKLKRDDPLGDVQVPLAPDGL